MNPERQSIQPTYDSRETGPRYHVTSTIDGRPIAFMEPVRDPFVRHTVYVGWRDLLRGLLRRRMEVVVNVGGDPDIIDDVLELDANALTPNSSRAREFRSDLGKAMVRHMKAEEAREADPPEDTPEGET